MKMIYFLFLSALLSSTSHAAASSVNLFCVADLKEQDTPSGYPCKPLNKVTVNDFVFPNFVAGKVTIQPFNVRATTANVLNFPGLNSLGISAAHVDMGKGGVVPMHIHPDGTELIIMVEGQMTAGFVTSNSSYVKDLKPGDLMVFPQGLLHFQVNSGEGNATAFAAYSSPNPGLQLLDNLLFSNNISSYKISKVTLIDVPAVKRLKAQFGGTG